MVGCFEAFEYPKNRCELIVLDDAGQYPDQPRGENWRIHSQKERFPTLGDKRNALADLASVDSDAFVVMDDDDVYMPWTLLAHAWALRRSELSCPDRVLGEDGDGEIVMEPSDGLFHSAWAYSRDLFERCGKYPSRNFGEDLEMRDRMLRDCGVRPCSATTAWPPWLIFRWTRTETYHMSQLGEEGYENASKSAESSDPLPNFRPVAVDDWIAAAATFYDMDSRNADALDFVSSWRANRQAHEVKMVRNRSRFVALRRLRILQTMQGDQSDVNSYEPHNKQRPLS